jgi:hypothetical protein
MKKEIREKRKEKVPESLRRLAELINARASIYLLQLKSKLSKIKTF